MTETCDINFKVEEFYLCFEKLKTLCNELEDLIDSFSTVDSNLVSELGYDFFACKRLLNTKFTEIVELRSRMQTTIELLKRDPYYAQVFDYIRLSNIAYIENFNDDFYVYDGNEPFSSSGVDTVISNVSTEINRLRLLAIQDSQISTSGRFYELSDFQDVMLSDLTLIELLFDGIEDELANMTISELFTKYATDSSLFGYNYDNLFFDENTMLEINKKDNIDKYRCLVLGKMIRYGFGDLKFLEKIKGKDGFDAFVMEDIDGNIMIHYSCTNILDVNDYLYDS